MSNDGSGLLTGTERKYLYCITALWVIYNVLDIMFNRNSEVVLICCLGIVILMVSLWARLVTIAFFPRKAGVDSD